MNTTVNFKLAELLKEKGFDVTVKQAYLFNSEVANIPNGEFSNKGVKYISAPTIAEVVMWLYQKHGIWIWVEKYENDAKFNPQIPKANLSRVLGFYNSPTEAYESAIIYTLNNLI